MQVNPPGAPQVRDWFRGGTWNRKNRDAVGMGGKDMKPIDALKEEHGGVKVMTAVLGKVCDRLDAGKTVGTGDLGEILEFFRVFVDTCHHAKEEEGLFPALGDAGVRAEGAPLEELLRDHRAGRALVRSMAEALPGVARGDGPAVARFVQSGRDYAAMILTHIDREDAMLFPAAEARLGEKTQRDVMEAFERIEEERIGHGRHEEFHRSLDRLKGAYGVPEAA